MPWCCRVGTAAETGVGGVVGGGFRAEALAQFQSSQGHILLVQEIFEPETYITSFLFIFSFVVL